MQAPMGHRFGAVSGATFFLRRKVISESSAAYRRETGKCF
jgi:hypothetical protein